MSASFARGVPHPALRDVVLRYEGYTDRSAAPVIMRELPCSYAPIILDLDVGWTIGHADRPAVRLTSFVAGLTDHPVLVGHDGSARCLQIDLTPLGARRLLGVPMTELANRTVAVDEVLGRFGHHLVQRLGAQPDWPSRFALLDQVLRTRLTDAPAVDAEVVWSLHRLMASGGTVAIGDLVDDLGWSHRRLIARFRDAVGLPPKLFARIVRFEQLTRQLAADPALDWADAAVACGYFDQAHLAREVRELARVTPTELRALPVNFVQDSTGQPA